MWLVYDEDYFTQEFIFCWYIFFIKLKISNWLLIVIQTRCHLVNTAKAVDIIVSYDAKRIILLLMNKSAERRSR